MGTRLLDEKSYGQKAVDNTRTSAMTELRARERQIFN
jgi:hypothetical protein